MTASGSRSDGDSWLTRKIFLSVFGTFFALLFLIVLVQINIATQMDDIEERLAYRPPGPQPMSTSKPFMSHLIHTSTTKGDGRFCWKRP